MASGKQNTQPSADELYGLIREAMALRVKYRLIDSHGKHKRRVPLMLLCVHPKNRGSIYPQPERVQNLGIQIHEQGEDESEANHNGVVVEEMPAEKQKGGGLRVHAGAQ